ncbi:hypothetical protein H4219_003223 [Mycoemilia scoparia]|uniref:Anaphase-promoting complex subunit 4-like WD40 domain-containing protein n=1 Tax=Mycoemilia scoparia TaxID=417184 RepID=A0A9W7ZZB9_9FUNG|nr:hypothetical protein H4219_003223 [Mycoemilia scoparia]
MDIHKGLQDPKELFKQFKLESMRASSGKPLTVAWNCTGTYLAAGLTNQYIRVWSISSGQTIDLAGHYERVDQVCWNPQDPNILASASADKSIKLWDIRKKQPFASIKTGGQSFSLRWSDDGKYIVTANENHWISIIDYESKSVIKSKRGDITFDVAWDNSGERLFISTSHGDVNVMSWPDYELQHTMKGHTSSCYCISKDASGRYLAVGSADALISIWDLEDYICIRTITDHIHPVTALSFSHDSQFLASNDEEPTIHVSDVDTGELIHKFDIQGQASYLAWHPKKHILAVVGESRYNGVSRPFVQLFKEPKYKDYS